jgi:hypothetical protein
MSVGDQAITRQRKKRQPYIQVLTGIQLYSPSVLTLPAALVVGYLRPLLQVPVGQLM